MGIVFWLVVLALTLFILSRYRLSLPVATAAGAVILLLASLLGFLSGVAGAILVVLFIAVAVLFNVRALRHRFFSLPILKYVKVVLPPMSETVSWFARLGKARQLSRSPVDACRTGLRRWSG